MNSLYKGLFFTFLLISSSWKAEAQQAVIDEKSMNPLFFEGCEEWDKSKWEKLLKGIVFPRDEEIWSTGLAGNIVLENIHRLKKNCPTSAIKWDIDSCLDRAKNYYSQFTYKPTFGYSAIMNDQDYLAQQPAEIMKLPIEFSNGLPQNWKEIAEKNDWKWAWFDSETNRNSRRLVFIIPGREVEQRVLFIGSENSRNHLDYTSIQMQTIEYKNKSGKWLNKAKVHFRLFSSDKDRSHPAKVSKGGGRCISCHTNGPLAITPRKDTTWPAEFSSNTNLEDFNQSVVIDRPMDFSVFYDLTHFPKDRLVGEEQSCTMCHNNESRSSLIYFMNRGGRPSGHTHFDRKIVTEFSMPPVGLRDESLVHDEEARKKLSKSIFEDQKRQIGAWLLENDCKLEVKPNPLSINNNKIQKAIPTQDSSKNSEATRQ